MNVEPIALCSILLTHAILTVLLVPVLLEMKCQQPAGTDQQRFDD